MQMLHAHTNKLFVQNSNHCYSVELVGEIVIVIVLRMLYDVWCLRLKEGGLGSDQDV